jgi:3-phenylpropionate/cinnamic acid dioxygenase small subunit
MTHRRHPARPRPRRRPGSETLRAGDRLVVIGRQEDLPGFRRYVVGGDHGEHVDDAGPEWPQARPAAEEEPRAAAAEVVEHERPGGVDAGAPLGPAGWQVLGRYEDWLELLDPDVRYAAPVPADELGTATRTDGAPTLSLFDDGLAQLQLRVAKVRTGLSQSENPPSRTVRMIGTIVVFAATAAGEHPVRSAFVLYRNRRRRQIEILAGHRHDLWRSGDCGRRLARRESASPPTSCRRRACHSCTDPTGPAWRAGFVLRWAP